MPLPPLPMNGERSGCGQALPEQQVRVEAVGVARVARHERHHEVGVVLLWPYVRGRVGLAPVELGEHLVGRVAAT